MSNSILIIWTAVQALATLALVFATGLLVKHTKTLAMVTNELATIEKGREEQSRLENKMRRIKRAHDLAEEILRIDPGYYGAQLFPGLPSREYADMLIELEFVSSEIDDTGTVEYLQGLLRDINSLEGGAALGEENRIKAMDSFQKFQGRLRGLHLHKWRKQLVQDKETYQS